MQQGPTEGDAANVQGLQCGAFIKLWYGSSYMNVSKQVFVSGRVQGVFFRESTRQIASQLKLSGGVRNLSDGRLEVQLSGDEENVYSLIKWLKIGPKLAKVSNIEVLELERLERTSDLLPGSPETQSEGKFEIWATD